MSHKLSPQPYPCQNTVFGSEIELHHMKAAYRRPVRVNCRRWCKKVSLECPEQGRPAAHLILHLLHFLLVLLDEALARQYRILITELPFLKRTKNKIHYIYLRAPPTQAPAKNQGASLNVPPPRARSSSSIHLFPHPRPPLPLHTPPPPPALLKPFCPPNARQNIVAQPM